MSRREKGARKRSSRLASAGSHRPHLRWWLWIVPAVIVLVAGGAIMILVPNDEPSQSPAPLDWRVPDPDTTPMQPRVAQRLKEARQAVRRQLDSPEAWGLFGAVCDVHDLYAHAVHCYRHAYALAPNDFRWPYLLAYVRELQGADVAETTRLFQKAAELEPEFPPVFFRIADALMREGKLDEARDHYRKAIQLDPKLAVAHRGLGQALIALGDPQTALHHLESAVQYGQQDSAVYAAMAQAYTRLGDFDRAEEAGQKSRRLSNVLALPDPVRFEVEALGISSKHCYDRAKALMQGGDYAAAIDQWKIAEESLPNDPQLHHRLGISYMRTGRPALGIEHYRQALELNPKLTNAHFNLGRALEQLGRVDEAIEHYRRAVQIDPNHPAVRRLDQLGSAPR